VLIENGTLNNNKYVPQIVFSPSKLGHCLWLYYALPLTIHYVRQFTKNSQLFYGTAMHTMSLASGGCSFVRRVYA